MSRGMAGPVEGLASAFGRLPAFDRTTAEGALRGLAESRGLKAAFQGAQSLIDRVRPPR